MKTRGVCVCGFKSEDPNDFEVHEVSPEVQMAFCKPCAEILELYSGK